MGNEHTYYWIFVAEGDLWTQTFWQIKVYNVYKLEHVPHYYLRDTQQT